MPCLVYLVSELSVKYWMKSRWRGLIVNRRKLEGFNSYNWNLGHLNAIVVQAQLREVTLKEENAAFENAISDCENNTRGRLFKCIFLNLCPFLLQLMYSILH